jgi:hypothetical protein
LAVRVSFLDRLKREADQQRAQAEAAARDREEIDARYKDQIEPRMKALTSYLEGLAATLNEVRPPITVRLAIQGYGDLAAQPVWDYRVEHERRHRSFLLSMNWTLRVDSERTPEVRAEGATKVRALTSLFRQHQMGGIKEVKRTPQGELLIASFHARGHVKASMQAQISAEDPVLRMTFENASWLGSSRRQLQWSEIEDQLFDRIARFIVREDDSLFTEELSEEMRQRLRPEEGRTPAPTPVAPPAAAAPAPSRAEPPKAQTVRSPAAATSASPAAPATRPAPAPTANTPASVPGVIPAPAPVMEGEVIQIDESKLGLWGDPDAPIVGLTRPSGSSSFGERTLSPGIAPVSRAVPGTIPAPAPLTEGDVIPIDESKLGLSGMVDDVSYTALGRPIDLTTRAASAPNPVPTPKPVAPSPTLATPRSAPAAPAAASTSARVAPTSPAAPAGVAAPARPAAASVATTAPSATATPPAAVKPTPTQTAVTPPPTPAPTAPRPPATPTPANAPDAVVTEAAGEDGTRTEAQERDAALFRLRMRAVMARLRDTEGSDPSSGT